MSLIISLIAAVVLAVIAWRDRTWGIALVLFALPTYLVRFSVLGIPVTMLELLILTLFVVYIASRATRSETKKRLRATRSLASTAAATYNRYRFEIWGALVLVVAGIISLIITPDLRAGAGVFKAYILEPILLFIVILGSISTTKQVRQLFWALGLSAVVISLIVAVQYFTGWGIPEPWHDFPGRRAVGLYGFPNAVGLYIAPILTAFIGLLLHVRFFTRKNVLWILMIILLMGFSLIASQVEGAIIAAAAGVGVMLLFTRWRWWAIGAAVLGGVIAFAYEPSRELLLFQDVSGDVRLALWHGTWSLLSDRPWFGAGLGAFPIVYDIYRLPSHVELLQYPHNLFLNFWVELGILGLLWIVGTCVLFITTAIKTISRSHGYSIVLLGILTCLLVYGIVDVPYFKNDLSVLFWFWLALLSLFAHKKITSPSDTSKLATKK